MISFLELNEDTRRLLISQASIQSGITERAIEKDWWVTLTLQALFSLPMAEHFIFKGGTSLSKGWKLIQRFSEDIDIALAPEAFGRKYLEKPSHAYVKNLKREGCAYTSKVILEALEARFAEMGVPAGLIQLEAQAVPDNRPDKDPQTLFVRFPSLYQGTSYLTAPVKIEFGVRALREPFSPIEVWSLLSEFTNASAYQETAFTVMAVEPRKTFIEKLLLLHEKFHTGRSEGEAGERQSRHLFDLLQMHQCGILQQVLDDPALHASVIEHRRHYVRLKGIDYDAMSLRQLLFIPPQELLAAFGEDYATMRAEMIYGDAPDFEALIEGLRLINMTLVSSDHTKDMNEVIQRALQQIAADKLEGDVVSTTVVYKINPGAPEDADSINILFFTEFIQTPAGLILHRIKIQ